MACTKNLLQWHLTRKSLYQIFCTYLNTNTTNINWLEIKKNIQYNFKRNCYKYFELRHLLLFAQKATERFKMKVLQIIIIYKYRCRHINTDGVTVLYLVKYISIHQVSWIYLAFLDSLTQWWISMYSNEIKIKDAIPLNSSVKSSFSLSSSFWKQ